MSRDENDRVIDGTLPMDPHDDARPVSDGPQLITVRDLLAMALRQATRKRQNRAGTTGNYQLDKITGGFRPGYTWVFGAETGFGKSSFCVSMADENLKAGLRLLIVSTEDAPAIYAARLLSRRAKLDARRVRDGVLTHVELARAAETIERGEPLPVYLNAIGKSSEWIAECVPKIVHEYEIDLIAVDYLQEIRSTKRHQDRRLELAYIAGTLRACIKNLGISGILFSQLTGKDGQRPDKYSIRDSQDVSNGAEVVVIGYVPKETLETKTAGTFEAGARVLLVEKNKDGPKGAVEAHWDELSACFRDKPDPLYAEIDDLHDGFGDNANGGY